jgi:hypothetical protein
MKIIQCLGIGLAGLLFSACVMDRHFGERGSGRMATEQRPVSGISGVSLATAGDLFIEAGNTESLRIEADDNLIPMIQTEVHAGILTIQTREPGNFSFMPSMRYYLTVTSLNSIAIFSSGNIQVSNLKAETFAINISSSGDLKMGDLQTGMLAVNIFSSGNVSMGVLKAESLDVNISSSGDVNIGGGEVKRQNIAINSSGEYRAPNLASEETITVLNSSGDADIRVRDRLSVQLNSSGDVRYRGNPSVNISKNSSGDVIHAGN